LVFYGKQIPAKKINPKYNAIDLVPTLSYFIGVPVPDKCQGKIIEELIE
jgi:hypothetical protein